MVEHCSSTEFSSAAEIYSNCKSRAVGDQYSLVTSQQKQKLRNEEKPPESNNTGRREKSIHHRRLNHHHSL